MPSWLVAVALVLPLWLSSPAQAQSAGAPSAGPSAALGCIIEPIQSAEVAAPGAGVVQAVLVDRGQTVRKGQLLATMTADVERAALAAARSRAEADAEIGGAGAAREAAKQKLRRVYDLLKLGFASQQELDQARSEFEIADFRLFQARETQTVARRELQVAAQQLELRQIRSPINGIVADRLLNPGERADGRPILRILALDRLRVEVVLPSQHFGKVREGMNIAVTPDIQDTRAHDAQVIQVDRFVDTASGTFRSRLLLSNPGGNIPAGVRCQVALNGAPALPVATTSPAPAAGTSGSTALIRPSVRHSPAVAEAARPGMGANGKTPN